MYPILMKWRKSVSGLIFKNMFVVTALKYFSTEFSGAVPVNTLNGLLEDIDDAPIRDGFIVIWSNSAAFFI